MDDSSNHINDLLLRLKTCEKGESVGYVNKMIDILLKNPELIAKFYRTILNLFAIDTKVQIKLVKFIETSCILNSEMLLDSVSFLLSVFPTCADLLKSLIINAFSKLYPLTHLAILNETLPLLASSSLYHLFTLLKTQVLSSFDSKSICVQQSIIKLCATLIISSDAPQSNSASLPIDIFNVSMVPDNHPILTTAPLVIKQDGVSALELLQNMSKNQTSFTIIYFLLEVVRIIGVSRPQFIFEMLSFVELIGHGLHTIESTMSKIAKKHIRKLIKFFICKIKNLSTDFTLKCRFIFQDALRMTSSEIDKEMARTMHLSKKSKLMPKKRKIATTPPEASNRNIEPNIEEPDFSAFELKLLHPCLESTEFSPDAALQITEKYLGETLTSSNVADLVVCGILMLPEQPPTNHFEDASTKDHVITSETAHSSVVKLLATQFTDSNIGYGWDKLNQFIEIFSNKNKLNDDPLLAHAAILLSPKLPENITVGVPVAEGCIGNLDNVAVVDKMEQIQEPFDAFTFTFDRILSLHNKYLCYEDIRKLYNLFISSIIILDNCDLIQVFTTHVASNLEANFDLLLSWFYKCWFIASTPFEYSNRFKEAYSVVFFSIVRKCLSNSIASDEGHFIKLILEVPHIPTEFLPNLQEICCDSATQSIGFKLLSELIFLQFKYSEDCLDLLLNLSISESLKSKEVVFSLILNIYPIVNYQSKIENFTLKCMETVTNVQDPNSEVVVGNVHRCLELLFQIFTLNHKLLPCLFDVFVSNETNLTIQPTICECLAKTNLPIFYESPQLLQILSESAEDLTKLLLIYLDILSTKKCFSPDLVNCTKLVYNQKNKDVRFLTLILKYLTKSELLEQLPQILIQPDELLKDLIMSILQLIPDPSLQTLSPTELLIGIHQLEDNIEMKQLTKAISLCLNYKRIFNQEVVGVALQQLIECVPIPALTMRTTIQALLLWPKLVSFVMGLLQKLISKQVWKQTKLWHGFIKCCEVTKPQSFPILLQLPIRHLENAFEVNPELHSHLSQHVQNMSSNQRSIIQKAVLQILEKDFAKSSEASYQLWPGDNLL